MKKINSVITIATAVAVTLSAACALTACGDDANANVLPAPTNFTFDEQTGEFSFDGVENAGYYYVRYFGYNEIKDADDNIYLQTSERISGGVGKKSGTLDMSSAVCGAYRVKLQVFAPSGTDYKAPPPVMKVFYKQEGVKLITPQFKLTSNGNRLTIHADEYVFATYLQYQQFPNITYIVKDSGGNVVQEIEHLKSDLIYDLNLTKMMNLYAFNDSATKTLNVSPGTYTVQAVAKTPTLDKKYVTDADVSETVSITVTATGESSAQTTLFEEPTMAQFGSGGVVGNGKYAKNNPQIIEYTGVSLSVSDEFVTDEFGMPDSFELKVSTDKFGKITATKGTPGDGEAARYDLSNENGKVTGSIVFAGGKVKVSLSVADPKSYFAHFTGTMSASASYNYVVNENGTYKITKAQGGGPGGPRWM